MKKLLIISFVFFLYSTNLCFADTLFNLYGDNSTQNNTTTDNVSTKRQKTTKYNSKKAKINQTNQTSKDILQSAFSQTTKEEIQQKASKNYNAQGYSSNKSISNPIFIDNPYNSFNNMKMHSTSSTSSSTTPSSNAVTFKKNFWGNIVEYDSTGKKLGTVKQ